MPVVYDNPIGPLQNGAPMGSMLGNSMTGIPIPSITGGAAGPSGATSGDVKNFIYANSGNTGAWLFISIAAIIGMVIWKKKRK